jgi:2,3-dihydroxyphenylpropionate 1,2-dioxygenase
MATIVFTGAMSHSPMMNFPVDKEFDREQIQRFKAAVTEMGNRLRQNRPDTIVIFGPDHFRALFTDLMPSFVIGTGEMRGFGDWNTPVGPFRTNPALANHLVDETLKSGFDPAFSREIKVDHGITQPLQLLDLDASIVPVLFNAAAPPLPTPERCHQFGTAVARAIKNFPGDLRVAIIASGGLSHDPPAPSSENALHGRTNGFAASRERETRLMNNVAALKARINPPWDRRILDHFCRGSVLSISRQLTTESIFADAGNGGQEIRTWIAAAGAAGDHPMNLLCYEPIDTLVTGMGVVVT